MWLIWKLTAAYVLAWTYTGSRALKITIIGLGWTNNHTTDGPTREACCMWSQRGRWGQKGTQNRQNKICLREEIWNYIQSHPLACWHFISNTHLEPAVRLDLTPILSFSTSQPTKLTLDFVSIALFVYHAINWCQNINVWILVRIMISILHFSLMFLTGNIDPDNKLGMHRYRFFHTDSV